LKSGQNPDKSGGWTAYLTLVTNNLANVFNWYVLDNLHDSDHFPIITECECFSEDLDRPRWKIKQANWEFFQENLTFVGKESIGYLSIDDHEKLIRESLLKVTSKAIPKSSGKPPKRYVSWWNQNIKNFINDKRKLLRKYKRTADKNVLAQYVKKRNEVRTETQKAREKSWEDFVSFTNKQSSTTELYSKVRKLSGNSQK
jgi:hypothetical protein